jgi:hypothetical protein
MAAPLYTMHPRALVVLYADLENHARSQRQVFVGTAGSVIERRNASGFRFYAHQFYDGEGRKRERYLAGPVGSPDADAAAADLRERISEQKELVPELRMLGREGFSVADRKTYATIAALANRGIFAAGAVLVGSHAYGVLTNRLGIRAAPYATEDIDVARGARLDVGDARGTAFLDVLNDSGIEFVEVPPLDRKKPSTSFKQRGRSRFHVDLLAPSKDEGFPTIAVPELAAHAMGVPFLAYLLAASQMAMLVSPEGCCMVRVPLAERFAVHKLVTSVLRGSRDSKSEKDVFQASVLAAVLAEHHPGALESAAKEVPRGARKHLARALASARPLLESKHPRAWAELAARSG